MPGSAYPREMKEGRNTGLLISIHTAPGVQNSCPSSMVFNSHNTVGQTFFLSDQEREAWGIQMDIKNSEVRQDQILSQLL